MTKVSGSNVPRKKRKSKKRMLRSLIIILVVIGVVLLTLTVLIACNATFILIILFSIILTILCFFLFFMVKNRPVKATYLYIVASEFFRNLAFGYIFMSVIAILIMILNYKTITCTQTTYKVLEHTAENPANILKFLGLLFDNDVLTVTKESDSDNGNSMALTDTTDTRDIPVENTSTNVSENNSSITDGTINNMAENSISGNNSVSDDMVIDNICKLTDILVDNNKKVIGAKPDSNRMKKSLSDINSVIEEPDGSSELILGPYEFSPLYLWGTYDFGYHITGEDITNMQAMYDTFSESKGYIDMLELPEDDYGTYEDVLNEVNSFDANQITNGPLVTSEGLYHNAMNRLFCYKQKGDVKNLEQSAISAEGAIEKEDIAISGSYNNYIKYAKTTIINFLCVLDSDSQEYESGTTADIKYRIAKAFYKPSVNLLRITSDEKYYSLCSAYLISKEALELSNSESKYAIDTAFYHLKICSDLASYMEPGTKRNEICREASGAYATLATRIEESGETVYSTYQTKAEQLLEKTDMLLDENIENEELDK